MTGPASCIYRGSVSHRRHAEADHAFRFPLFMMYLDLAEVDRLFQPYWFWSASRPALARFRRTDHLGDPAEPLDISVRRLVQERTGCAPTGPIRLLTHLAYFGYCFNPLSVYYCHSSNGEELTHVVAEVQNTPWRERHCYVLPLAGATRKDGSFHLRMSKEFHVSPFMEMDMEYRWTFNSPGARTVVHIENHKGGDRIFDATLDLERVEISSGTLALALLRYPLMTGQVILGIHYQALRLWLKNVPVHPHSGLDGHGGRPATGPGHMSRGES